MITSQSRRRRTLPEVAFFRASLRRAFPMILLMNLLFVGMPSGLLWLIEVQIGEIPESLPFPARFFYGYLALLCVSAAAVALPPVYELSMRLRLSPLPLSDKRLAGITWSAAALLTFLFCSLVHLQIEAIFCPRWNALLTITAAATSVLVIEGTAVCIRGSGLLRALLAFVAAAIWFCLAAALLPDDPNVVSLSPMTLGWLSGGLLLSWLGQTSGWQRLRHGDPGLTHSWETLRELTLNRLHPEHPKADAAHPQTASGHTALWTGMPPAIAAATVCGTLLMTFLLFSMSSSQLRDDRVVMQPLIALMLGGLLPGSMITGMWLGNLCCRQNGLFRPFWATIPLSDRRLAGLLQFTAIKATLRLNLMLYLVACCILGILATATATDLASPQQQHWLHELRAACRDNLLWLPLLPVATLAGSWTLIAGSAAWFTVSAQFVQSPLRSSFGVLALCWSIALVFANNHLPEAFQSGVRAATCSTMISPLLWQWSLLRQLHRHQLLLPRQLTLLALWMILIPVIVAAFQQTVYATLALILCGYAPASAAAAVPLSVRAFRHS